MAVVFPCQLFEPRTSTLVNFRKRRYQGDDLCLAMSACSVDDQRRIRTLYSFLQNLFEPLRAVVDHKPAAQVEVQRLIDQLDVADMFCTVRDLGRESLAADDSELLAKTMHDVRGGAMTALLGRLQFAEAMEVSTLDMRQMFFQTRDHLKIMRNALLGLDDAKREADLQPQLHGTNLIVEKWEHALLTARGRDDVRLEIDCSYSGAIAECCVEFGAVDRVLYNLVNNAARHTSDALVRISISPELEFGEPTNLRFIVSNHVSEEEERQLADHDLGALFEPGASSTGSGFGLTVAADFVGNAFGVNRQRAVREHYLGAGLADGGFHAWFHWPIVADV